MAQMKIKYYNIKEEDVWLWWSALKEDSCFKYINPVEVIRDIKTGTKEWYFQGVPLRIKPLKMLRNTDGDQKTFTQVNDNL
jgi:hypothetical protein